MKALRRQHEKLLSQCKDSAERQRLLEEERMGLMSDSNFQFFTKSELNLDLAEIQMSFNDLITLKAIAMRFDQMNDDFERYMEHWNDGQEGSEEGARRGRATETRGRLSSGSDNDSGLALPPRGRGGRPQKVGVTPRKSTKQDSKAHRDVVFERDHRHKHNRDAGLGASSHQGAKDTEAHGDFEESKLECQPLGNKNSRPLME